MQDIKLKLDNFLQLGNEIHAQLLEKLSCAEKHQQYIQQIREMQPSQQPSKNIRLNVGGTVFETQRSLLLSPQAEDSMLFALGSGWFENDVDQNEIFIDRDGTLFSVILDWLRNENCKESNSTMGSLDVVVHSASLNSLLKTAGENLLDQQIFGLNCLQTEARYFGLDKLVAHTEGFLQKVRCTIPAFISVEPSRHIDANTSYCFHPPNGIKRIANTTNNFDFCLATNFIAISGSKTTFTVLFQQCEQIELLLHDETEFMVLDLDSSHLEPPHDKLSKDKSHTLTVCIDMTDWKDSEYYVRDLVVVMNDEYKWDVSAAGHGVLNSKYSYLVPFVGTTTVGGQVTILNVQIDRPHIQERH